MSWLTEIAEPTALRERAEKNLSLQVGMANPLWLAFGAAATAGAAWWILTRWARPAEGEAKAALTGPDAPPASPDAPAAVPEVQAKVAEAAKAALDDLTKLSGVGPKTAKALLERGVSRFSELAAWSYDELAEFDAALKLKGRSLREDWIEQARVLAEQ